MSLTDDANGANHSDEPETAAAAATVVADYVVTAAPATFSSAQVVSVWLGERG